MVEDKWLESSSISSDVAPSEFPCKDLAPVELPLLSSSVGSAAGGGGGLINRASPTKTANRFSLSVRLSIVWCG